MEKISTARKIANMFLILALIAAMIIGIRFLIKRYNDLSYPVKYGEIVEKYSSERGLDKSLVYAIIRCESSFEPSAVSKVGARGLMQITSDTFEWIKFKMGDKREMTFDDMYDPELNIEYGTFLLSYLFEKFTYTENVLCAYHAGIGIASDWLENDEYTAGGMIVSPPYKDTAGYVEKVIAVAAVYERLYSK